MCVQSLGFSVLRLVLNLALLLVLDVTFKDLLMNVVVRLGEFGDKRVSMASLFPRTAM